MKEDNGRGVRACVCVHVESERERAGRTTVKPLVARTSRKHCRACQSRRLNELNWTQDVCNERKCRCQSDTSRNSGACAHGGRWCIYVVRSGVKSCCQASILLPATFLALTARKAPRHRGVHIIATAYQDTAGWLPKLSLALVCRQCLLLLQQWVNLYHWTKNMKPRRTKLSAWACPQRSCSLSLRHVVVCTHAH